MVTNTGAPSVDDAARSLAKRFYARADIAVEPGGVALLLDGRPARTPARNPILLPTEWAALAIAEEWNAVETVIDPRTMPMTRLANSVIDGVSHTREAVLDEIQRYAGSDLLAYRAPDPAELVAAQAAGWDPIITWARERFGAELAVGSGIVFVAQPTSALQRLGAACAACIGRGRVAPFRLGALHVMTTLTGSALLALAVAFDRLRAEDAWALAHLDEDHQIAQWGEDAEAAARRERRWIEMRAAARLDRLSRQ